MSGVDDHTEWTRILVEGWGPLVLGAVVQRVEGAMVGRRGVLVRALGEERRPSPGHAACVEEVHERILEAIRVETGADLDALGSQAAWATYDQVWGRLQQDWGRVPTALHPVPPVTAGEVVALVRSLTPAAATRAGADVGVVPYDLLRRAGTLWVDLEGLFAHLAHDTGEVSDEERQLVRRIVALVRA